MKVGYNERFSCFIRTAGRLMPEILASITEFSELKWLRETLIKMMNGLQVL